MQGKQVDIDHMKAVSREEAYNFPDLYIDMFEELSPVLG